MKLKLVVNNEFHLKTVKKPKLSLVVDNGPVFNKKKNGSLKENFYKYYTESSEQPLDHFSRFLEKNALQVGVLVSFVISSFLAKNSFLPLKVLGILNLLALAISMPFIIRVIYLQAKTSTKSSIPQKVA